MTGLIFDIKRFAIHDGPGIRTTVFFKGCPLSCIWCHNPESRSVQIEKWEKKRTLNGKSFVDFEELGEYYEIKQLVDVLMKDADFWEESGGGVTFSGGEPLMQTDFLLEALLILSDNGIHTCIDTCGYTSQENLLKILPLAKLFLFDLKHYDDQKHKAYTGVGIGQILDNLNLLLKSKQKVWIRIPLIPTYNDSKEDFQKYSELLKSLGGMPEQINLLPYHNTAMVKYERLKMNNILKDKPSMTKYKLNEFAVSLRDAGYKVKIGG